MVFRPSRTAGTGPPRDWLPSVCLGFATVSSGPRRRVETVGLLKGGEFSCVSQRGAFVFFSDTLPAARGLVAGWTKVQSLGLPAGPDPARTPGTAVWQLSVVPRKTVVS